MENSWRSLYQERSSHRDTLGVLMVEKNKPISPLTDNFDVVLLIIMKEAEQPWLVKHYEYEEKKASLHIVTEKRLNEWLLLGSHRRAVEWVINGKILFDRNEYMKKLKEKLREFPIEDRTKKIGLEFAKLIRRSTDGRDLYQSGHYLDAFNYILHALHHLARLSVIKHGFHPEVTVWNQVKQIEPQIYKLYHELVTGAEPLEKRIELLLLANEFSLSTKTEIGARHLLQVMRSKEEEWSYGELMSHGELMEYGVDLGALLEHLVQKKLVTVQRLETKGKGIFHRMYALKNE
ncbi:nucleotidyltransferase-like protein [Bacillus taeanensis]|uniref:Nucleotidyltransferase-like domain-containing protein n=1 Tax=Bacillus taeanensis TaxID=273032 RepID=A0A366XVC9_9BACI|nr:nucleotidyltransferase-like protein [Bacillus taeanensis]RBW68113.1 hypothetical protein DS031_18005 [Bacillus taeanensis]